MEASIRDQVNDDRDCTVSALRLMGLRQELTALVREWSLLGGGEHLPTIRQRPSENHRAVQKRKAPPKQQAEKSRPRESERRRAAQAVPLVIRGQAG
jgi:hypothetical protein